MDYAILNDQVQVWEINGTPTIMTPGAGPNPRAAVTSLALQRVAEAFEALSGTDVPADAE